MKLNASKTKTMIVSRSHTMPRWKINSFISEISVCWRCTEKITIQTERAFSVILRASPATHRSFQPLPQHPTVAAENLRFNTPLAIANARWRLPSHTIVDCICSVSASVYCNRGCSRLVSESTWLRHLLIEVATATSAWRLKLAPT